MRFQGIENQESELERDRALVAFCRARLAERADTADTGERLVLAGIQRTLDEFAEKFEHPARFSGSADYFAGQVDTLGWTLRSVAFSAFYGHGDFRVGFRP